jgi:hypothetical protein
MTNKLVNVTNMIWTKSIVGNLLVLYIAYCHQSVKNAAIGLYSEPDESN